MKSGYKQTKVGALPVEWKCGTIGDIASSARNAIVGGPFGSDLVAADYVHEGVPVIRGQNMGGRWVSGMFVYVTNQKAKSLEANLARPGDIVFTQRGTLGQVSLVPEKPFPSYLVSQSQMKLTVSREIGDPMFFFYVFTSERQQDLIRGGTIQTGVPHINLGILRGIPVQIPPLSEQRAIAKALSDMDALLDALDRLIAKKRDLKQAAAQQLLTGQKRLPGFHNEWQVKTFGELFNFSGGYSASREQLSADGHCYLHYGDIHTSSQSFIDVDAEYRSIPKLNIPLKRVSAASLLNDGDVVFVDASEDDAGTSKHVVVVNKEKRPFISGLHTIVAKGKTDELGHGYRRYCFQTKAVRDQFLFYSVGTKVSGISKSNIKKLILRVPSVSEQAAIAQILSAIDEEIEGLELRRQKTLALKQGMMQELLTGKTRLVSPEPAHA